MYRLGPFVRSRSIDATPIGQAGRLDRSKDQPLPLFRMLGGNNVKFG